MHQTETKNNDIFIKIDGQINGLSWAIISRENKITLNNTSGYNLNEGNLGLYIQTIKHIIMTYKRDYYNEKEIIKQLVYNYLKIEVLYLRNAQSEILRSITGDNELLEYTKKKITSEINEIKSSAYGNIELINHLQRTISIKNEILDEEIIRSIVRCNDPELVREINKELVENSKDKIRYLKSNLRNKTENFKKYYENFLNKIQINRKIKKQLALSSTWFSIIMTVFIVAELKVPDFIDLLRPVAYKAKIESISSLGEKETTEDYLAKDVPTRIMEVYSETYEIDGSYYKDKTTYDLSNFETTSEIEKYFTIDLELIREENIETKINAEELKTEGYKVLKSITLDLKNYTKTKDEKEFLLYILWFLLYLLITIVAIEIPNMPIDQIKKTLAKYKELKEDSENLKLDKEVYIEIIKEFEELLKNSNIELNEILKLYEEIEVLAKIDSITPEERIIKRDYESFKKEIEEIGLSSDCVKLKKLLKIQ